jgi:DNA-binding MarR family transcriptional regulator
MESGTITTLNRSDQIDYVSKQLPSAAGLVARLLVRQLGGELSRTEVGLLSTLSCGPRRITDLAELEGLAQPTMTSLVKGLEQQGLVRRDRQADDGRVVLVHLTDSGAGALEDYRVCVRELLGSYLVVLC